MKYDVKLQQESKKHMETKLLLTNEICRVFEILYKVLNDISYFFYAVNNHHIGCHYTFLLQYYTENSFSQKIEYQTDLKTDQK